MKPHLHHAALNVADLDWYAAFFQETFAMEVRRTSGEAPARKIWFSEGIQLNECPDAAAAGGPATTSPWRCRTYPPMWRRRWRRDVRPSPRARTGSPCLMASG